MTEANNARREQDIENQFSLYEIIDKNPGLTIDELRQKTILNNMKWTTGKVACCLNNLVMDEMIDFKSKVINGRIHKIYYGKSMKEFIKLNQMADLMDKKCVDNFKKRRSFY